MNSARRENISPRPAARRIHTIVKYEASLWNRLSIKRQIVGGGDARTFAPAGIEMLVAGVQRQGEKTLGSPLETMLAAVTGLDGGAAVARKDIDHLLEHVLFGDDLPPGARSSTKIETKSPRP